MTEIPDRMVELGAEAWTDHLPVFGKGDHSCSCGVVFQAEEKLDAHQVEVLLTAARVGELLALLDEGSAFLRCVEWEDDGGQAELDNLIERLAALNAELGRTA